jgi:hypothetical protein
MDVSAWLAEMEKTYTTSEQRAIHRGAGSQAESSDITFF